ncbi:alkaline phosphatase synthesis transcriptional regulatory protein PhoP [archaeon BMS3Abin16]|nr:alkaline phosphatase synthesis transcriptional regulatory protein PhoP [archaeon BMS3Abin16]HDY74191.1 response regulator [Euryarchaeota archaeon]
MKTVMVVDDDEELRSVVTTILKKEGYNVVEAGSGERCIELLKTGEKPDLILLDVMMPDMDGWETCKIIKDDQDLKDLTVAMLTLRSQDHDKIESLGLATADWHIDKPINKTRFVKTVKWLLGERS